jgi:hypothetical protein
MVRTCKVTQNNLQALQRIKNCTDFQHTVLHCKQSDVIRRNIHPPPPISRFCDKLRDIYGELCLESYKTEINSNERMKSLCGDRT